jgi:hypothetical protein
MLIFSYLPFDRSVHPWFLRGTVPAVLSGKETPKLSEKKNHELESNFRNSDRKLGSDVDELYDAHTVPAHVPRPGTWRSD